MTDPYRWRPADTLPPCAGLYERREGDAGAVVLHRWLGSNWSLPNRKDWAGAFVPQSGLQWRALPPTPRDPQRAIPAPPPCTTEPTAASARLLEASAAFFSRPVP